MHVRDRRGVTTADLGVYSEVIEGVMSRCPGMITQVGNGIGLRYEDPRAEGQPFTLEERMNLLNIQPQPDQLTLNLGTFHFEHKNTEFLFPNSKKWNSEFVKGCNERGIRNELEVYDLSHIQNAIDLAERGVLEAAAAFQLRAGHQGRNPGDAAEPAGDARCHPRRVVLAGRQHRQTPAAVEHDGAGLGRQHPRRHGRQRLLQPWRACRQQCAAGRARRAHRARARP